MPPEDQKHPEAIKRQSQVAFDSDQQQTDWVQSLVTEVNAAQNDRSTWEVNLARFFKKRYGLRHGTKTSPWPGASNTHIALTDEKIRKLKPNYMNLAFEGTPLVTMFPVNGTPQEAAASAETFMDWLLRFYMDTVPGKNYFESMSLVTDWMLEKGFSIAKVIWHFQSRTITKVVDIDALPQQIKDVIEDPDLSDEELGLLLSQQSGLDLTDEEDKDQIEKAVKAFRNGDKFIPLKIEVEIYNGPRVIAVPPKDIIVPSDTTDVESARFIAHRMWMTMEELQQAELDGKYENTSEVVPGVGPGNASSSSSSLSVLENAKANKEGVHLFLQNSNLAEIWEIYTWFDIDGDGSPEKVVLTIDANSQTILRLIEFPYDHQKWPFIVYRNELNDDRWYSPRGIPEMLDHYQTIVTNQENAKLDRMTLANSLQFKYRIGSVNPSQIRFIPGQGIPVQRMDDLQELPISNLDASFDTEMAKIRGLAEQLIGQPDLSAGSLQKPQERRTAFEVSEVVALGRQVFSYDARLFNNSLQKMYDQIFDLWMQYGPDEVWVGATGSPPFKLTREQILGNFVMTPNGEISLLSRTVEVNQALQQLQIALSDQSGAVNQYEFWVNYLYKADPKMAKKGLNTREQFAATQQQRFQQQQAELQQKFQRDAVVAGRTPNPGQGQNGS